MYADVRYVDDVIAIEGNIDQIGQALGVVIMSMTIVFAVSAGFVEVDGNAFGNGLLPNIPAGGSVTVLSMMATTCIPFNMFLAASMVGDGQVTLTTLSHHITSHHIVHLPTEYLLDDTEGLLRPPF